jgi:hypothetical protein
VFSGTGPTLEIPPFTLVPGLRYSVKVTAKPASGSRAEHSQDIDVGFSPLVAFISGGDRLAYLEGSLLLNASSSHDPDFPPERAERDAEPMVFTWSCVTNGAVCRTADNQVHTILRRCAA